MIRNLNELEKFKDYDVTLSDKGEIYSTKHKIATFINKLGYEWVVIDNRVISSLHRLVALLFVEKPIGKNIVDHINGDITNNCADNLQFITQKENLAKHKERKFGKECVHKKVNQFTKKGEFIKTYKNCTEAGKAVGGYGYAVRECCVGKRASYKKFVWKYVDE